MCEKTDSFTVPDEGESELSLDPNLSNIIVLQDENGKDVSFEFLDLIEYEEEEYVVLLPAEEADSEEISEVVILRVTEGPDEDTESYVGVDNDETLQAVFALFKEKFKEEFNFTDGE